MKMPLITGLEMIENVNSHGFCMGRIVDSPDEVHISRETAEKLYNYQDHFSNDISLKKLGIEFNLNSTYLGTVFKKDKSFIKKSIQ